MAANRVTSRPAPWLAALCVSGAAVMVLPSVAMGAEAGPTTLRSTIGSDGKVVSTKSYASDGTTDYKAALPVSVGISRSTSGGRQTFSYHVQNTTTKQTRVTWNDLAEKPHSALKDVALPLVAQLGVTLPASYKDIDAPGATITRDDEGASHLLWQLVLFAPIGSPTLDVSFTATGNGDPSTQLRASAVDTSATPGIAGAAQAANEAITQGTFWRAFASGGNDGLNKLITGVGAMVKGLGALNDGSKALHQGLVAAGTGAAALDKGAAAARSGGGALSSGLSAIDSGASGLSGGLKAIRDGQGALTAGIGQVVGGQQALTTGLGQLDSGLAALKDPATGLPAVGAGLTTVSAGLQGLLAGLGSDATAGTLLNGTSQIAQGVDALQAGVKLLAGCTADVLGKVIAGAAAGTADSCFAATGGLVPVALPGLDPASAAVLTALKQQYDAIAAGTDTTLSPAFSALTQGLALVRSGLSHPSGAGGPADPGGVKEGVAALSAGIGLLQAGLSAALTGVSALSAGATAAYQGSQALTAGSVAAEQGAKQLQTGTATAYDGSVALSKGIGTATAGGSALAKGLVALADGTHALSKGLPAAVNGSDAITRGAGALVSGATAVSSGLSAVQDAAVTPLQKQIDAGGAASRELLATLNAGQQMTESAPGGEGASYVLASDAVSLKNGSDSDEGTSPLAVAGLAVGGALLLLLGLGAGVAVGRGRQTL